ncbi:magnesium transporter MRS2-3-like isoform X4 [Quercus robur]|uniref:magnesium transporter MRS2-3-like isoform X3 n=1 Tax=Quercus robur TaxID=38942 RepID=UPI0021637560|nr:magnesium transporter MRS2-3-like isoform X3 [Quercus robur]XP_050262716.1 magnesium transporter MRS2-3-like isoform X4 [Quercus robur]
MGGSIPAHKSELALTQSPHLVRATASGPKKKGTVRAWLVLNTTGQAQVLEAGKSEIMSRTGLPGRDLRSLDPVLSYASSILGRERAIVINLENIKAIVTHNEVLLLNSRDPSVTPFIEELQKRLHFHYHSCHTQEADDEVSNKNNVHELEDLKSRIGSSQRFSKRFSKFMDQDESIKMEDEVESKDGSEVLPFEFVALEACLEATCSRLDSEARTLEKEAHPALDKLTSSISTLNLERVRQIKSRLVAITGRVQKVRDELEHLLNDDGDMAEMYLTEKFQQSLENSSTSSINERDDTDDEEFQSAIDDRVAAEISSEVSESANDTHSAMVKNFDVKELEMLLEPYFVQIDGTLNTVSTLREYVDDTEDYLNIMLDDKQNHLLQMGVLLSTATVVVNSFIVVAGILGMNIRFNLFNDVPPGNTRFLWTCGGGTFSCIVLYIFAIAWYKQKRLLER